MRPHAAASLALAFLVCFCAMLSLPSVALSKDIDDVRILTEPPKTPYKELGKIHAAVPLSDPEFIIAGLIAQELKSQAASMGADAIILGTISRIPEVYEEVVNHIENPFRKSDHLSISLKIEAVAIAFSD